jgi:guanylate kinase
MSNESTNTGKVIIFSAPSGAGKSTVVGNLLKSFPWLGFSVSATSREPRGSEKNGIDYFFYTPGEFRKKIDEGAFIEYEEVYEGRFYGTLESEVTRLWAEGKIVVFDIDVKGALNLKKLYGNNALTIFIKPPSLETLKERLTTRGTDSPQSIKARIDKAREELSYSGKFDVVLVNDNLQECLATAKKITRDFYNKKI